MPAIPQDLTGRRFGLWIVVRRHPAPPGRAIRWVCLCAGCGREHIVGGGSLVRRQSRGCRSCRQRSTPETRALLKRYP